MPEQRFCPQCGLEWPNFCPIDGQRLSGPWSCSNAAQTGTPADEARTIPSPAESRREALSPVRLADVSSAAGERPAPIDKVRPDRVETTPNDAPRDARRVPAALAKTQEYSPSPSPEAPKPSAPKPNAAKPAAPPESKKMSAAERRMRTARTQLVEAITPELLSQLHQARASADAEREPNAPEGGVDAVAAPVKSAAERRRSKRGDAFSETQWFLKGVKAEIAVDDEGEVLLDDADYAPDESMTPEERKRYSLRAEEEES